MDRRKILVAVSGAQLTAGIAGQTLAVRRRLAFDIALISWCGRPDRVAHDTWLLGTGVSAPVTMLATQAGATARLAIGPAQQAERVLGLLGAAMVGGYLVEREFRAAMKPSGWDGASHRLLSPAPGSQRSWRPWVCDYRGRERSKGA